MDIAAVILDEIRATDTSVFISWSSTWDDAIRYDVRISGNFSTFTRSREYTITIQVFSDEREVEYTGLLPGQSYGICVFGIYSQSRSSFSCRNTQTSTPTSYSVSPISPPTTSIPSLPDPTTSLLTPTVSPHMEPQENSSLPSQTSSSFKLLGGILGSIIALLVLLLMAAGVGLAYPHCIRSRVKGKTYSSR